MRRYILDLSIGGFVTLAVFFLADNGLLAEALARPLMWPWYLTLVAGTDGSLLGMLASDWTSSRVIGGFLLNALYLGALVRGVRFVASRVLRARQGDASAA